MRKRNIYKIVHFKGYYPPISFWTCPYFLRSTSDPIRRWIIGLVSDLYRRRVGGGTESGYVCCGNILGYRMLWALFRAIFVRKSEIAGFSINGKCGIFNMFTFLFLHSLSSCRLRMKIPVSYWVDEAKKSWNSDVWRESIKSRGSWHLVVIRNYFEFIR